MAGTPPQKNADFGKTSAAKWLFAAEACEVCLGLIWDDRNVTNRLVGQRSPVSKVNMGGLLVPIPGS